jgi:hypothetical protein
MNTSTIWYSIDDPGLPQCDSAMVFASNVPAQSAAGIAKNFADELVFITQLDPECIKVWVE